MSRVIGAIFKKAPKPSSSSELAENNRATTDALAALEATLTLLKDSVAGVPVPGLQASVGGLLSLVTAFRVSNQLGQ